MPKKNNTVVLVNDGHARLVLVKDIDLGEMFKIVSSDSDGFISVILNRECWNKMKNIVDEFLNEK